MHRDPLVIQLQRPGQASAVVPPPPPKKRVSKKKLVLAVAALVFLALLAGIAWWIATPKTSKPYGNDAQGADVANVVSRVGALMLLPSDETPTVATVSDTNALQDQAFFKNAHVGDVVLMYPKTQKAILYSPSQNKIIEVAPITVDTQ